MRIAVIAAMQKELRLLLQQIGDYREIEIDGFKAYEGRLGNHEILAAQCGIGKVNSALRTDAVIRKFNPDLVINSGVAGGVDESMKIGSVLVADRVAYHDVWCGPGTEYGAADGCPLYFRPWNDGLALINKINFDGTNNFRFGLLCSGDKFIANPKEVIEIKSYFPEALGCDMESASIAQTCHKHAVPFMVIRVMSDMPGGGENISEYQNFWSVAPARTFEAVRQFILSLP